ncbi:hypothetical protein V6Z98_007840 [Aspergillus fumigatus]
MYQAIVGRSRPLFSTLKQRLQTPDSNQRRKHVVRSDTYKQPGPISVSSLRLQGPAWVSAGGGIYATLFGVYRMLRSMRQLRYI